MAAGDELLDFVREALSRGVPRPRIEDALRKSGWTPDQICGALTAYADLEFPIPVPRARPYLSARDAFVYLVLFGTLYASAYNLGSLLFDFINRAFPDPAAQFEGYDEYVRRSIRWSVSSLIVAFPVFLCLSWLTERDISRDPTKRASKVRRWLTYLTLFSAACALLGDFTTLVRSIATRRASAAQTSGRTAPARSASRCRWRRRLRNDRAAEVPVPIHLSHRAPHDSAVSSEHARAQSRMRTNDHFKRPRRREKSRAPSPGSRAPIPDSRVK